VAQDLLSLAAAAGAGGGAGLAQALERILRDVTPFDLGEIALVRTDAAAASETGDAPPSPSVADEPRSRPRIRIVKPADAQDPAPKLDAAPDAIERWSLAPGAEPLAQRDLLEHVAASGPLRLDDEPEAASLPLTRERLATLGLRSLLAVPFAAAGVRGVVVVGRRQGWAFAGVSLHRLLPAATITGFLLERSLALAAVERRVDGLEATGPSAVSELDAARRVLDAALGDLDAVRGERERARSELEAARNECASVRADLEAAIRSSCDERAQREELAARARRLESLLQESATAREALAAEVERRGEEIRSLGGRLEAAAAEIATVRDERTSSAEESTRLRQQLSSAAAADAALVQRLGEAHRLAETLATERDGALVAVADALRELEVARHDGGSARDDAARARGAARDSAARCAELEACLAEAEGRLAELQRALETAEGERASLEARLRSTAADREGLRDELLRDRGAAAAHVRELEVSLLELERERAALRRELEAGTAVPLRAAAARAASGARKNLAPRAALASKLPSNRSRGPRVRRRTRTDG
jgi:predicted  nucleic acid-binding Zn-ribbon protein